VVLTRCRLFAVTGLLVMCAACANITAQQLRAEAEYVQRFTVARPYPAVYRSILAQAGASYAEGFWGGALVVEAHLFPDTQSGELAVVAYLWMGKREAVLAVEVKALPTEETDVVIFSDSRHWHRRAAVIESWATRGSSDC
jgi:hypothetical protein